MNETASEVMEILALERGLSADRIERSSRLLQDLGMDGDDAVDFFITLHERFGTDLSALQERWSDYFGPEGFSCWNGLVILPVAVIGGVVAAQLRLTAVGGVAIAVGLLAAWLWAMRKWSPPNKMKPITVEDVIVAVEAGAWPRPQ